MRILIWWKNSFCVVFLWTNAIEFLNNSNDYRKFEQFVFRFVRRFENSERNVTDDSSNSRSNLAKNDSTVRKCMYDRDVFFILISYVFKFAFQKLHCINDFLFMRLKIFEYHSKRRIDVTHRVHIFFYDFVMINLSVFEFYCSFFH